MKPKPNPTPAQRALLLVRRDVLSIGMLGHFDDEHSARCLRAVLRAIDRRLPASLRISIPRDPTKG